MATQHSHKCHSGSRSATTMEYGSAVTNKWFLVGFVWLYLSQWRKTKLHRGNTRIQRQVNHALISFVWKESFSQHTMLMVAGLAWLTYPCPLPSTVYLNVKIQSIDTLWGHVGQIKILVQLPFCVNECRSCHGKMHGNTSRMAAKIPYAFRNRIFVFVRKPAKGAYFFIPSHAFYLKRGDVNPLCGIVLGLSLGWYAVLDCARPSRFGRTTL